MSRDVFRTTKDNFVEFFKEGEEYYHTYIDVILKAKHSIMLQTYIFHMDHFGRDVHSALIEAAKRGVKVYVMVDSVGSRLLEEIATDQLKEAGVHFIRFNGITFEFLYRWGRRLHHKILIIDQELCFLGGINIISGYDKKTGTPQLDFAVLLKGPIVDNINTYAKSLFSKNSPKTVFFDSPRASCKFKDGVQIKLLINDWVHRRFQISKQYSYLTRSAQKEILIINSYFFPKRSFMYQLVEAASRGIRVRLILPKYSDWPTYILASEYLYDFFLKNGVEIYQWNLGNHHGKLAIIDDNFTTIGSFNLNYTSYQQNLEMNVNVYSQVFVSMVKTEIEELIIKNCTKLSQKDFSLNSKFKIRFLRFYYYLILSMISNFSVGLIYQEQIKKENQIFSFLRILTSLSFFIIGLIGLILPFFPGIPFFLISFLLIYKQIIFNRKFE